MDELRGKTAFITGGASGIGLATAHLLGAEGMNLVVADVEEAALATAEVALGAAGYPVLGVRCDVRKVDDLEAAARATIVDSIKADRFWILPHGEESHGAVRRRAEAIIEGTQPPVAGSR